MTEQDEIMRVQAAMARSPRASTPIFRFLFDHHDEMEKMIRRFGKNWSAVASALNELGIKGREGKDVSPDTVRKTWKAVHKAQTERLKAPFSSSIPPKPASPNPPVIADPAAEKFRPATLRNGGRGVSVEERRALGDLTVPVSPDRNPTKPDPMKK